MAFKSLILFAAAGAAAGAAVTTSLYATSKKERAVSAPVTQASSSYSTSPSAAASSQSRAYPLPSQNVLPVAPVDPNGVFKYGFPGPINDIRPAPSLTSCFNRQTRNPHWVAEHITRESLSINGGDRKGSTFYEDPAIPSMFQAKLSDYLRSGYDRGHQVPAADAKWSQEAMDATFSLSNMCPQVGEGFNRDYWAHFEDFCRRLTLNYPSVRIVTGPLYLPRKEADGKWRVSYEVVGHPPNVAVPTHFYKVIFGEDGQTGGKVSLGAFVLPNAPIDNEKPLKDFEVPLEIVERASGLEFASKLPADRKKKLCQEVDCSLIVRQYADRQKAFGQSSSRN